MCKIKIANIVKNEYLTIKDLKTIPSLINEWLVCDEDYTLDNLIEDQTKIFSNSISKFNTDVIKIEKLEWTKISVVDIMIMGQMLQYGLQLL